MAQGRLPEFQQDLVYGDERIPENWFRGAVRPYHVPGLAYVIYTRISDEVAFRNQIRRSNGELEQFAYVASHDLQEPIRMVASWMAILAEDHPELQEEVSVRYIREGAARMQTLVDDLLRWSRIGSGDLDREPVGLQEELEALSRLLEGPLAEAGARLTWSIESSIRGDRGQLRQALQNLVSNALKFRSPERPALIEVRCRQEGPSVLLSVTDNGIGIPPEYQSQILEPFRRLHSRDDYEGNGIGLGIVRAVAERHDGVVTIESVPGQGSTFTLVLPA